MERKRKKTSADYPQLSFRLPSKEERDRLDAMIEEIQVAYNKRRKAGELVVRRNDVVLAALERGLKSMKKGL